MRSRAVPTAAEAAKDATEAPKAKKALKQLKDSQAREALNELVGAVVKQLDATKRLAERALER